MRLVLLGPPGAGKGTQAQALSALWGIPQIASGDLLRAVVREDSELGREAASYMDRGQLVPDEFVLKLIAERFRKKDARSGFILDGFPRNVMQAEALGAGLERAGLKLDKVVAVTLPDDEILKRITGTAHLPELCRDVSRSVRAARQTGRVRQVRRRALSARGRRRRHRPRADQGLSTQPRARCSTTMAASECSRRSTA